MENINRNNSNSQQSFFNVIKYEGDNNVFVWKHPTEDFSYGSQLIVHETQEALFFRDGKALDLFGAGRYTLESQNIPLVSQLHNKIVSAENIFHCEIYFINLATHMAIKWGTDSPIGLFDPVYGMHFQIGACGEFNLRVIDSRKLVLKLVGTEKGIYASDLFSMQSSNSYFKSLVITKVKSYLASVIKRLSLNILELDSKLDDLSYELKVHLNPVFEEYGLEISHFYVTRIALPEDDPNFRRLKQQFADQYLVVNDEKIRKAEAVAEGERKAVEAETIARLKMIDAQGQADAMRVLKQAEAEIYKMKAEAEAAEMRMKGYTYQQETSRMVGLEAMKNGLGGNGNSSLGDIAGLGIGLGAMSGVLNATKEAMNPAIEISGQIGESIGNVIQNAWNCACGRKDIQSNFCPDCGQARPNNNHVWNCECGTGGIESNFCPNCGRRRK